ncbi:MAG: glycosyltransferase family 39 protein [Mariprofundaceae bacterium]|nr:glycosyltransferase family 39 protein [Mariprofundaceae bacterium]
MFERMAERPLPWLLLLAGLSFAFMLGGHALWDVDEPNNAVCAREMLAAGNWWVPMFNGDLRFDKPILLYWLMMPLFSLFGVHEWTARLPSAMAMSSLVFVVWYFARRLCDARTALVAALLMATVLHAAVIGRAATPDPLLILFLAIALLSLLCFHMEDMRPAGLLWLAYIALGFGVLAKGPIAIAMPGLIMPAYLLLAGRIKDVWRFRPFTGLALILLIALPWYIGVGVLTDGVWLKGFLLHHNIDRFTQSLQGHRGFPGFYIVTFLAGWFPWTGMLIGALSLGSWRLEQLRQQPMRLFMLCWIGAFLLFFTAASTRLPNYMLPAFPAAAVLMALWMRDDEARALRWAAGGAMLLAVLALIGAGVGLNIQWPGTWSYALCFIPLLLAAVCAWRMGRRFGIAVIAGGMALSVALLALYPLPGLDRIKASPELARAASAAGFDGAHLATYRYFQPSLLYYHGGRLPLLDDADAAAEWLTRGGALVMPEARLADFPDAILPWLEIHARRHGMYARQWLVLVSLKKLSLTGPSGLPDSPVRQSVSG